MKLDVERSIHEDICGALPDEEFSHIFHLAAFKSVPIGEALPKEFIINNCWGTTNLLRKYPNAKIINISSSAANEVRSVYGATKLFTEMIASMHKNCLSVRLYNVFGEGQLPESGALIPSALSKILSGQPVKIYGDGNQMRDFTYVEDVVKDLKEVMFEDFRPGVGNIGYGIPISVNDIVFKLFNLMEKEPNFVHLPERDFDIKKSCAPVDVEADAPEKRNAGLVKTAEWFKNEYSKA